MYTCIFREITKRESVEKAYPLLLLFNFPEYYFFNSSWHSSAADYSSFPSAVAVWLNTTKLLINAFSLSINSHNLLILTKKSM